MQPTSDATPHTNPFLDPVIMDITPTISAVSDEAPPPSVPTPTAPTSTSLPSSERAVLNSEELLALLLAPDLDESLTPGALLGANNVALFHLLPLILAAVQRVGEQRTLRERFVSLVSVLRMRISACRGLKLRFLLLIGNAGFAQHWDVKLVHRQDCYVSARQALHVTAQDAKTRESSSESLALAHSLTFVEHRDSKRVADWYNDKDQLVLFAARNLFHPREGIHVRNVLWHMRTIRSAFFATELVDGIMERANFQTRGEGVNLAQQLVLHGIIYPVGANKRSFTDDKRRLYQCRIAMQHDDAGHCRVVTSSGNVITNWSDVRSASCNQIRQIGVQIAMDMIDLQSHEFWTRSVYVKGVDKGYRYGYRAITHPLHCIGVNIESHLESNASSAKGNPDIILETAKSNGNGNGNGNGNTEDANTSGSSLLSQSLSTMDINHLRLDSSIVGSVIVRKVFSSIARPMIVELRVPMEDADLTEDDHHLSLSPSVLVKEGDNLMQDLGVEIMFQCFNYVWAHSPRFPKPEEVPMSISYEVFPTSPTQGFMEAVTGLSSMKEYDWNTWMNRYGKDPYRVMEMMRSVAGSYVGAYVCGYVYAVAIFTSTYSLIIRLTNFSFSMMLQRTRPSFRQCADQRR